MAIVRWNHGYLDPLQEMERIHEEINRLFDYTRTPEVTGIFDRSVSPAVDMVENDEAFVVRCDLPGVKADQLEISVTDNVLTIKGEKKGDANGARVYRKEVWEGNFQRTVTLPMGVDADKVEARLKDGVLTLTLPKREEHKPRQIAVKAK